MKRALAALALLAGMLPGLASAQIVQSTFGLGNVREPTANCGTDGCQILIYDSAPTGNPPVNCTPPSYYTEAGCARRGPDAMISSGLLIQSDRTYPFYPIPGTFTIEENVATGAVTIVNNPDGTTSGHVNNVALDLDLGFDTFLIPSALNFSYVGGTGTHINDVQGDRIVWNNNLAPPDGPGVPYLLQGCLTCLSGSGSGCNLIGLGPPTGLPEGYPVCDALVQPSDPRRRVMPNWVSTDGFASWHFPDNGDGTFTGGDESIVSDSADIGGVNNGGGWVFFGFRGRECGTKNTSEGDPQHPNLGKPDYDCDGNADWTYGLGAIDEPACYDTTRWCTGTTTECNFDGDCNLGGGQTCDPLPESVCAGTATECFVNSECGVGVTCDAVGTRLCTNTATNCTSDGDCSAPATCDATSTPIPAVGGDYICRPIVECPGAHVAGTPCPAGCFENVSLTTQCNKLDRSLIQRTSALSLMRDPDHDHFPLRGTIEIVEDLDAAQTKWCSGGSAIAGTPKVTAKKFCSSVADCPAGETCDQATTVRWCSGTSTVCTTNADCDSSSLCAQVGTVYVPPGSGSAWNTNSVIVAQVPIYGQTFTITASGRTGVERATGRGSPNDVIVWNPPTQPYTIPSGGCYYCSATSVGTCPLIALNDRLITCNAGQIGDPEVREWPDWISFDQGRSFQMRNSNGRPGDPNPGHIDPIIESYQSAQPNLTSSTTNNGPVVLFGYLRRECGTTNDPNAGNTQIYKFCSLEDEFCVSTSDCPNTNLQCNQALGICTGASTVLCSTRADCPVVEQTCSRPAGNPFNPRGGKADHDCDRKVDPGVFPLASDPLDPEFPGTLPLPSDLVQDVCITYAQTADTDSNGDGHGNQCSCGDQNGDGAVNVSDIVAINNAIFNPSQATTFCDANNDARCNVSDIVDTNIEIFSPGTTANCVYNLLDSNP